MSYKLNIFTGQLEQIGTSGGGGGGSASYKDPVANHAALPLVGNSDGDVRVTLDTDFIWVWSSGDSSWHNNSNDPSLDYRVDKFTLNGTDITNKFVTLSHTPISTTKTRMQIIGGVEQDYSVDFSVSTNQVGWNGLALDGVLQSGDKLIIIYS